MKTLQDYIDKLNSLNFKEMYENDFFLTWEKTDEELDAVWTLSLIHIFPLPHKGSSPHPGQPVHGLS